MDGVKAAGFKSRKSLKEYCYQQAKVSPSPRNSPVRSDIALQKLYNAQQESDKTTIIQSAILLTFWYVDREDIDGSWHWLGVASSLCHGIGLHRETNYARLPHCPFPTLQQAVWRRIWWCCYYREAWLAVAMGRPMRLHLDDCDVRLPSVNDVSDDVRDFSPALRDTYLPPDLEVLAGLWIGLLQLSTKLEHVLLLHYRPRRPPLSLEQLERDEIEVWQLLDGLPRETDIILPSSTLRLSHLTCYFNSVIIALYRSYMSGTGTLEHLTPVEQRSLQGVATQRAKNAASSTTTLLNRLVSLDMIKLSPSMIVTAMMSAMQIHFFELAQSGGLARQHAFHNLNLHMIILSHLKNTYWTADMQQNLFTECLKAIETSSSGDQRQAANSDSTGASRAVNYCDRQTYDMNIGLDAADLGGSGIENSFVMFNHFFNMQPMFDPR